MLALWEPQKILWYPKDQGSPKFLLCHHSTDVFPNRLDWLYSTAAITFYVTSSISKLLRSLLQLGCALTTSFSKGLCRDSSSNSWYQGSHSFHYLSNSESSSAVKVAPSSLPFMPSKPIFSVRTLHITQFSHSMTYILGFLGATASLYFL